MRSQRRLFILGWLAISAFLTLTGGVLAQGFALDFNSTPLDQALLDLGEKAGIDIVFAHRYTRDHLADCSFAGTSVEEAFVCVLKGTDLFAEVVRPRQYVIVLAFHDGNPRSREPEQTVLVFQLQGQVLDSETGTPLPGTHVLLPVLEKGTIADEDGKFAFGRLPSGPVKIRLSFVGYESRELIVDAGETLDIQMSPTPLEAGEVVIEGNRAVLGDASSVAGAVRVFERQSRRQPSLLRSDDIFGMLQWLPAVRHSGEVGGRLAVRGSGPDMTLHVLDGAPLFHPWQRMGLFSTLQTAALKDAQLYAGSIPAEYGGRLSAVLATTMRDGNAVEPHVEATVGSMSSQFVAETPVTERFSIMVAGRRSYADGLLNSTGFGVPERATLQNSVYSDFNAKMTARPWDGHEFRLAVYTGSERPPVETSGAHLAPIGWGRYLSVDGNDAGADVYHWTSSLASLQHSYLRSPRLLLSTTAFYSAYRSDDTTVPFRLSPGSTSSMADLGLRVEVDYFSPAGYTLRGGVQANYHRFGDYQTSADHFAVSSNFGSDGIAEPLGLQELAAYAESTWKIRPRLQIQPGLRLSQFGSRTTIDILPRFNMRFDIDPDRLVLKAGISRQVQYVHQVQDQTFISSSHMPARWIPAATGEVDPATGLQANVGVESRPLPGLELRADTYWRFYTGVLVPTGYDVVDTSTGTNGRHAVWIRDPVLAGGQRGLGLEISASYTASGWSLWTSYVGERAEEETTASTGLTGYVPARLSIPHTLRLGTSWTNGKWALALIGEVRNGYPVAVSSDVFGVIDADGETTSTVMRTDSWDRLPVYGRLDATIGYRFPLLGARWLAQLDVFNLTNRSNIIGHLYEPGAVIPARSDLKGLPRLPLFKLRVEI